jgi:hypothetical protein
MTAGDPLTRARALQKSGDQRAAIAAYHEALRAGAPAAEANLQLGVIHAAMGEHGDAIRHLQVVLAEQPAHADALCVLGTVLYDQGRYGEATRPLEEALRLRPGFAEALFNLGLVRFETGDLRAAAACIGACSVQNRGAPWEDPAKALANDPQLAFSPRDMAVNPTKLRHDCEQIEYLLGRGLLPALYREVLADYRALLAELGPMPDLTLVVPFDAARHPLVARTYKRPIHVDQTAPPSGPLINPALDDREISRRYREAQPNVIAIDGLVTQEALQALRTFCLDSTIWNNVKAGYLGAYLYDGFCSELLLRLAYELRERLGGVIRRLPLQMMWGYKCDPTLPALGTHADAAAVNVNFWITDDAANLDAGGGGLLVHTRDAPRDWGFAKFNMDAGSIERYLESVGSRPLRFPYRANRAVIFDSDLFHASDSPRFREGYTNRRVNITLLYGLRTS